MISRRFAAALILAVATALTAAHGQTVSKRTLTLDGARRVLAAAEREALRDGAGGVIAVVDDGGNLVAVSRLDGTFAAGANIAIGKARTAALFKRPTKAFEEIIKNGRTAMVALQDFTPLQGGVPIVVGGDIVGAVGVSGAANADRDNEVAEAGARSLADGAAAPASPVSYWSPDSVRSSFARGGILLGAEAKRSYMVHTSRRAKAGQAEVHALDTDIVYVVDGTATLVTGGTVRDGKPTEPNELRGSAIDGGEVQQLTKGAVVVIPAGTPHWFRDVPGPLTYFVVKAR